MKLIYSILAILILPGIAKAQTNTFPSTGSAGIGTVTPVASSILEMNSTTKGMLVPRMTKAQRDAIVSPATGLMIYQTNSAPGFYYYDGNTWKQMSSAGVNKSLSNLTTPTAVNTSLLPAVDTSVSLGSSLLFWKSVYTNDISFNDGTTQTTAFNPYIAGPGISIAGGTISNSGDPNGSDDANLSLANLSATSINQSLIPADNARDLGSPSFGWRDLYLKGSIYFSGNRTISFAGTDNTFVGVNAGVSTTGTSNSFFGKAAGQSNTSGAYNAFVGQLSGQANTSGSYNAFFGQNSGSLNTIGFSNAFFGNSSGQNNTSGVFNSFFGQSAGYSNITGSSNSFFGRSAGSTNTTGNSNSFFGINAGFSNSTAPDNSFFGGNAGYTNSTGYSNSFFGKDAGYSNSTGPDNSFFGKNAGYTNSSGNSNSFFGKDAGYSNATGVSNAFFGKGAGYHNTTGNYNSYFGQYAGYNNTTASGNSFFGQNSGTVNTAGNSNSFFGQNAGSSNTTASLNSFFGHAAGQLNTAGDQNSFFGEAAGSANTNGYWNSFFGQNAGAANTEGDQNTFFGKDAGRANTTGGQNSVVGDEAGYNITTGTANTFIGHKSGNWVTTGDYNTLIGAFVNGGADYHNSTAIGFGTANTASNQVRIGDATVTSIGGYAGWTNISDGRYKKEIKENVPGLTFINKLRPVTYRLDIAGIRKFLQEDSREGTLSDDAKNKIGDAARMKEQTLNTGFIAQEVEKAAKDLNFDFSGVDKPQNENSLYGLRYAEFVVPLVKAVQELSKMNNDKEVTIQKQNDKIDDLEARLNKLETMMNVKTAMMNNQVSVNNAKFSSVKTQQIVSLSQNIPNPFNHATTINYSLPQQFTNAQIIIAVQAGKTIKKVNVSGSGKGSLTLDASALSSGIYNYSLYANGVLIGSKQMVLTK